MKDHVLQSMAYVSAWESEACYSDLLEAGVACEIARSVLPVSMWTEFRWGINLHNLLGFIELRSRIITGTAKGNPSF